MIVEELLASSPLFSLRLTHSCFLFCMYSSLCASLPHKVVCGFGSNNTSSRSLFENMMILSSMRNGLLIKLTILGFLQASFYSFLVELMYFDPSRCNRYGGSAVSQPSLLCHPFLFGESSSHCWTQFCARLDERICKEKDK